MSLSIRNQIPGTVVSVTPGEVMATVKVRLDGGQDVTAAITLESVEDLGLVDLALLDSFRLREVADDPFDMRGGFSVARFVIVIEARARFLSAPPLLA